MAGDPVKATASTVHNSADSDNPFLLPTREKTDMFNRLKVGMP